MLEIKVNGKMLFIAKGTAIQVEMNNSLFETEKVSGDITYTFDVPAEHNNVIFGNANKRYVAANQKFDCIVYAGGVEIAYGDLYVQSATPTTYSVGIVMNPYPKGWADLNMDGNDYGDDIVISHGEDNHKNEWKQFLQKSLDSNSDVKFPLFYDEDFYGNGNKEFGMYLNASDNFVDTPSGIQASIHTSVGNKTNFDHFYVNRLFTDKNGNVIEDAPDPNRGIHLFNRTDHPNGNSFAFAPAIRLLWILEKVCRAAGYTLSGNFRISDFMKKIYHQSLFALDANSQINNSISFDKPVQYIYGKDGDALFFTDPVTQQEFSKFKTLASGIHNVKIQWFFYYPEGFNIEEKTINNHTVQYDYDLLVAALRIQTGAYYDYDFPPNSIMNQLCSSKNFDSVTWNNNTIPIASGRFCKDRTYFGPEYCLFHLGSGVWQVIIRYQVNLVAGTTYAIFGYCRKFRSVRNTNNSGMDYTSVDALNAPILLKNRTVLPDIVINTFATTLHYADHMPTLSNAEFVNAVCNIFGLNYFIDSVTHEVEMSFFKDIADADSLDLTHYVLDRETIIEKKDDESYSFVLGTELDEEIDEKELCDEVIEKRPVPNAKDNVGKLCFIKNLNKFQISTKNADTPLSPKYGWEDFAGNVKTLTVGEGENKDIKPKVIIPFMRNSWNNEWPNLTGDDTHICPQINAKGVSRIFDTGESDQNLILLNCHGLEKIALESIDGGGYVQYEFASPVCWRMRPTDENDSITPGINLTATGVNSVGESLVKPVISFLTSYRTITEKFLLPLEKFLEVARLLKPQPLPVSGQTRWITVSNTRMLPVKMTFEFTQGREFVLAEIEMALPNLES